MPEPDVLHTATPVTEAELRAGLAALGVRGGAIVMVHASLSRLGWVVGGSEAVVRALLGAVGPEGTVCAQASWEDSTFGLDDWPDVWRRAYETQRRPFDPLISECAHFEGRVAERIRTWPGACRSANPDAGVTAVGARAAWLTADHGPDDAFGPDTPYAKLREAGGQIVLLGAPLDSISMLHHAEATAEVPGKRRVRYRVPVSVDGAVTWRWCHDIDVRRGPVAYARHVPNGTPPLAAIAGEALAARIGRRGTIGRGQCHLFEAKDLIDYARAWIEDRFG
jgi:aminoglycoside 3-N-acetyltransferase